MAFHSGFFNSKNLDRTYTAEDFTAYLSNIICNGILDTYGQNFKLTPASSGLGVLLGTGKAWSNGHYFINDARYSINLSEYMDESLPRYVGIAIYLDTTESVRSVTLKLFPGTPAESPQLPSIPQDKDHVRLLMYAVRLNPGATSLTERDWYDYREDRNVCGYCRCILGKCKVTEMLAQMAQLIAEIQKYNVTIFDLTGKVDMLQTKVDDLTGDIVATGSLGENIYYVKYSNGRLLLRGSGATYDYDLGESPFWEDESIKSLVVSEGITAIGDSVFERCSNMTSASFPTTLKSIGKRAFFMYTTGGLTSLNLPASVTKIGEKAFTNIAASSLVMPETLTELGTYLFMDSNDKNVGGSGTGQHTLGNAADICCYGQDGQPISSKLVCCKAQDIGFRGIANITAAYIYTHVDVRPNSKWYSDEVHGNSTVTGDFYKYFGMDGSKDKESDKMNGMKGIDVSVHNGNIDWNRVKKAGIQFAILRAGYGKVASQKDKKFEDNYTGAKAAGIPVGAYWYSYATTPDEAKQEAEVCVSILKGKQFEFPIFFDQEEKATLDTGKANCSAMVRAFCEVLEKNGYWVGLYTSRSVLSTHIEDDIKARYALWVAEWGSKLNYGGAVGIWQYSEKSGVDGVSGNVDLDMAYVDYATKVKAAGLNGYGKTDPTPTPAPDPKPDESVSVTVSIGNETYKGTLAKS